MIEIVFKLDKHKAIAYDSDAKGFYEHRGFKTYKRTELDEQGNAYPILHRRLEKWYIDYT